MLVLTFREKKGEKKELHRKKIKTWTVPAEQRRKHEKKKNSTTSFTMNRIPIINHNTIY